MKKSILLLALALSGAARATDLYGSAALTSDGACVVAELQGASVSTLTETVTGSWSGTLTHKVSSDKKANYANIPTTRTSTVTATANGSYEFKVAGYTEFEVCFTKTSGTPTVTFFANGGILAFSPSNPGAIGGSTPAAGTFTTLTATSETLTTPLPVASGGTGRATGGITTVVLGKTSITSTATWTTTCTGGSLLDSTRYYYRVMATNCAASDNTCTEVDGTDDVVSKLLGACSGGNAQTITLSWSAVAGATGYNIYRSPTAPSSFAKITAAIGTTGTSYTDTGSATSGALPSRNSTADEVHVGIAGTGTSTTAALPSTCTNGQQVYDTTASVVKVCASNTWTAIGAGTVTSVAQTAPGEFTVGGSPITGAGTLALSYTATQTAGGVVYADGTKRVVSAAGTSGQPLLSGGSGAPTWGTLAVAAGGTSDTTTGWSGAAKPASPDARNDEFDGTAYSGWTTTIPYSSCAQNGTAIDPFAAFTTATAYRHSWNSYWPGWVAFQPTNTGINCGIIKAATINTNDVVWVHIRHTMGSSGITANTKISVCLDSDTSATHFVCAQILLQSALAPVLQINSDGSVTTRASTDIGSSTCEYIGLSKVGTSFTPIFICQAAIAFGASVTNSNTMADVELSVQNNGTEVPGNTIFGFDFVRFLNSATALPW